MKENSIEEDMKYIHKTLNDMRIKDEDTFISAVATIFRDYKRALKENEILKKEKEQAWEEWNNIEQGSYETEQKLKQQLKKLQKENEKLKNKLLDTLEGQKVIEEETPQYIKENYIPKSKVEETIAELVKEYKDILSDYGNIDTNLIINIPNENVKKHCGILVEKIIVLQELIEGSED